MPGYVLTRQVPPTSPAASSSVKSSTRCRLSLMPVAMPPKPAPMMRTSVSKGQGCLSLRPGPVQPRRDHPREPAQDADAVVGPVERVAPHGDAPVAQLEAPVDPEALLEAPEADRVAALGEHGRSVCRDGVEVHAEARAALVAEVHEPLDPPAPVDGGQRDV